MASYEVNITWVDQLRFVGTGSSGHAIVLDVSPQNGGTDTGMSGTELLLAAIGKCTAVDVVRILKKQRIELKRLEVIVTGDISAERPKYYEKILLKYIISGDGLTMEKAEMAVNLSHEKYCIVANTLAEKCEQITAIEII
jgi:putative redox protein